MKNLRNAISHSHILFEKAVKELRQFIEFFTLEITNASKTYQKNSEVKKYD